MGSTLRRDSDRPEAVPLSSEVGKSLPLHAFAILAAGDAFEEVSGVPPRDGRARAEAYLAARVRIREHGAPPAIVAAVRAEIVAQLQGNPQLVARLQAARPIEIDLVPPAKSLAALGFPKGLANAVGLFWDHPSWPHSRIGLLQQALETERALVIHEFAHAISRLAFTKAEQEAVHRLMLPTYRRRAAVEEVFAIYSEREFLPCFSEREWYAPGVYGLARRRWDERHVFTRFVRFLYHPYKPLAGSLRPVPRGLLG